jgi:hypothetical protein
LTRRAIAATAVTLFVTVVQNSATTEPWSARYSKLRTGAKKLGKSEYAERFAENDVDMGVLTDLTDQHLKYLGVSLSES